MSSRDRSTPLRAALLLLTALELGAVGWAPIWTLNGLLLLGALAVASALPRPSSRVLLVRTARVALAFSGWALEVHGPGGSWTLAGVALGATLDRANREFQGTSGGTLLCLASVALLGRLLQTPLGFQLEEALSGGLCALGSLLIPGALELGPVYSGARLLLAVALILTLIPDGPASSPRRSLVLTGPLAIAIAVMIGLTAALLPVFGSGEGGAPARIAAGLLPWVPLVAWFAILRSGLLRGPAAPTGAEQPAQARSVAARWSHPLTLPAGLAGLWLFAALVAPHAGSDPTPRSVAIYEQGLVSWGAPSEAEYGQYSAGMMGTLGDFMSGLGAESELVEHLTAADLVQHDTLVMVNLDHRLPPEELASVREWIQSGGSLILLGDHTFLEETPEGPKLYLNDVLENSGVKFINDSADQLLPGWNHATTSFGPLATLRCESGNPSGMLVGGSLDVAWGGAPIQVGRFGYSDIGVEEHVAGGQGFLGDLLWNPGERLGGVVGAAWSPCGDGLVVAVGDTTGGTNLGRVLRWEWWSRLLSLDFLPDRRAHWTTVGLAAFALLLASLATRSVRLASGLGAGLTLLVAGSIPIQATGRPTPLAKAPAHVNLALVDLSGRPQGRTGSWESDGLASLAVEAHRDDFLPLLADRCSDELVARADLIYWPCGQIAPSERHVDRVLERVDQGATLVVSGGHLERRPLAAFLDRVDAWIAPTVFQGQAGEWVNADNAPGRPFLPEPWWLGGGPEWVPRLLVEGRMVVGERSWGLGRIVLIADPMFLTNYALEGKWGHNLGNVETLSYLAHVPLNEGGV